MNKINKLSVQWIRQYHKMNKKGVKITMHVYSVTGEDTKAFEEAMGDNYRVDENSKPVWISPQYIGDTGALIITSKGKVVADTSEMDKAVAIVSQYGGNLGDAIAKAIADKLVNVPAVNAVNTPAPSTTESPIDNLG